ncbi:hypothetical protein Tco_0513262 [Tanacetum coccineum]
MISFIKLVESTHLWKLYDMFSNEVNAADGICLVLEGKDTILKVKQQQFAMQCDVVSQEIQLLLDAFKNFEFDFLKWPDNHGETQLHINATNDGTVHAVVSWYVVPDVPAIFYQTDVPPKWITSPLQQNGLLSSYSCNKDWCKCLITRNNVSGSGKLKEKDSPFCVIADDSLFLTVAVAHLSRTSHIISFIPGLQEKGTQYLQTVADENGYSMDQLEVISSIKKQWTMNDTHQKKVTAPNPASADYDYLEQPIPPALVPAQAGQQVALEALAAHAAWVKGSKEIAGIMLMTMEPEIQLYLENLSAYEMLQELKTLFTQQADQELLQTVQNYSMHGMGKTINE